MLRRIKYVFDIFAVSASAGLLVGLLQAVHPLADSFSHFRMYLLFLVLGASLVFCLQRRWKMFAFTSVIGLIGLVSFYPVFFTLGRPAPTPVSGPEVKLVQFNSLFDNKNPQAIVALIKRENPDLVALQEISAATSVILKSLETNYPEQKYCPFTGLGGVVILSRHPASASGCEQGSGATWMRMEIEGQPLTLVSLHLHWPYPFRQHKQIDNLTPVLQKLSVPIIVAGDFNAAPWSHGVERIERATQTEVAKGVRNSLIADIPAMGRWPILPVDHVLASGELFVKHIYLGEPSGSDHLPLIANFQYSK